MGCPLCVIERDAFRVVAQTLLSICVIPLSPLKKGHIMVLPKRHIESFVDFSLEESKDLLHFLDRMRVVAKRASNEDVIVHGNSGVHSSQPHLHLHLVPSKGDLRSLISTFEKSSKHPTTSDETMGVWCAEMKTLRND